MAQLHPTPIPTATTATTSLPTNHTLGLQDSLGAALTHLHQYAPAVTLLRETLATRLSLPQNPTSPDVLRTKNNLAAALHHAGERAEAETLYREVLAGQEETATPARWVAMQNFAALLEQDRDPAKKREGEELRARAREVARNGEGTGAGREQRDGQGAEQAARGVEGQRAMQEGRWADAERSFREALGMGVA